MSNQKTFCLVVGVLGLGLVSALLLHAQTQKQIDEMNMRGDKHMGFDHTKTTHHFFLARDGGAIQVEANNAEDTNSRDQIRSHLRHITMMFSDGNFEVPMLIQVLVSRILCAKAQNVAAFQSASFALCAFVHKINFRLTLLRPT